MNEESFSNPYPYTSLYDTKTSLRWRHNGRDSASNHQSYHCLLNRLFRRRSKKTSKLRVTGLCAGNSPGIGEFPAQMASNAENVSIWWRHHVQGRNLRKMRSCLNRPSGLNTCFVWGYGRPRDFLSWYDRGIFVQILQDTGKNYRSQVTIFCSDIPVFNICIQDFQSLLCQIPVVSVARFYSFSWHGWVMAFHIFSVNVISYTGP